MKDVENINNNLNNFFNQNNGDDPEVNDELNALQNQLNNEPQNANPQNNAEGHIDLNQLFRQGARRANQRQVAELRKRQQQERERQAAERRQQESNAEAVRNLYRQGRNEMVDKADQGYKPITDFYALDNDFQIPDGLSREVVSAAVIGALMDNKLLQDLVPDMIEEAGSIENLQKYFVTEIFSDGQIDGRLNPVFNTALNRVSAAINDYANGKQNSLKDYLKYYATYTARTVGNMGVSAGLSSDALTPEQKSYQFCKEFVIDGPLRVKPEVSHYSDINEKKLISYSKQLDSLKAAERSRQRLINDVGRLSRQEKEEIVGEMLLDSIIANMGSIRKKQHQEAVQKNREDAFRNIGLTEADDNWNSYTQNQNNIFSKKAEEASYIINDNTISEFDVLMSVPYGRDALKAAYMDKIKQSDIYRNIVNSENPKTMIDNLMIADHETQKGINALSGVEIPAQFKEMAKTINAGCRPELEAELTKLNAEMADLAMGHHVADDPFWDDQEEFKDFSHDSVFKKAKLIDDLYQMVKKNDTLNGSGNYGDMKRALKELRDYTKAVAVDERPIGGEEIVEYTKLVNKVNKLADHYLMNKDNIDKPSSLQKVAGVRKTKKVLLSTLHNIDLAENITKKKITEEYFGDKFRLFDSLDPSHDNNRAFYGDKYSDRQSRVIHGGPCSNISTARSAGTSIAIMALAATGKYTFEDLMDPRLYRKEKKAMYDEVIQTLRNGDDPANREKVARWIHDGRKVTDGMLDEQVKKTDFKNVDIYHDKQFTMLLHMYKARFDVEQEMFRIRDDYVKVAKQADPNFRTMDDAKVLWTPMMEISQSMQRLKNAAITASTSRTPMSVRGAASNVIGNTEIIKRNLEIMDQKKQMSMNTHVNDWFNLEDQVQNGFVTGGLPAALGDKTGVFEYNPQFIKPLMPKMLDGSFMKKTKYESDFANGRIVITEGFPTEETLKIEAENLTFLKKTDEAIRRLEQGKDVYTSKKDFVRDSAYAIFGQMYRAAGNKTPIDTNTGKRLSLEEFMEKQLSLGVFEKSLKSKKNPKAFTNPENIAKMAKNKNRIDKIIRSNAIKNREHLAKMSNKKKVTNPTVKSI